MKAAWRKYLRMRAPRYTSYPSALHFDEAVGGEDYRGRLEGVGLYEPLSIYVHVPFCRQLCWFCGCNMQVERDPRRAERYVAALCEEIRIVARRLEGRGRPRTVHFGGGTPNFLSADEIAFILGAIEIELGLTDDVRLAIELDPRLLRGDDIPRLAALGFNRMSIGVQDFDLKVQTAINRVQSLDLIESAIGEMRRSGVDDISFDLLYGLPKQTCVSFAGTLEKAIALSPDRVAVFGYAHLPNVIPRQRLIDDGDLPDEDLRADLALVADSALLKAGYRRIGFDHYARPGNALARAALEGRVRRNFQGFTDDLAETTIGFGVSAISRIANLYVQNEKDITEYYDCIGRGDLATACGLELTARERATGEAIHNLLCRGTADVSAVLAAGAPAEINAICARLDALEADGLVHWRGDVVVIPGEARLLSRIAAMALDPYELAPRGDGAPRLARAV